MQKRDIKGRFASATNMDLIIPDTPVVSIYRFYINTGTTVKDGDKFIRLHVDYVTKSYKILPQLRDQFDFRNEYNNKSVTKKDLWHKVFQAMMNATDFAEWLLDIHEGNK